MKNKHYSILCGYTFLVFVVLSSCLSSKNAKQLADDESISSMVTAKIDPYIPFVIVDKDGYTNIREQPNANSKIIGKIHKYQLFFSIDGNFCESGMYATDHWEAIESDGNPNGYIYKKNILQINNLPSLKSKGKDDFSLSSNGITTIIRANDSIQITIGLQSYDRKNHQGWIYGGTSDAYEKHIVKQQVGNEVKEVEIFDNNQVETEIKIIEIIYNGQKTTLPIDKIQNYCDPLNITAYIGFDGELYLGISGGGDAAGYGVWFSIVNGEIVFETMVNNCW